jgi:anti-sigma regulatory factor (Ser/Thr protein kinase)
MAEEIELLPQPKIIEVRHEGSVGEARRTARSLADIMGFSPQACEEIALSVTELATNLVKHAHGGVLTLLPTSDPSGRVGLEIQSRDEGPGIADVEQAIGDRFSTSGTRGNGLGAVNRLMDELEINSKPGRGTRILCRKRLRENRTSTKPCPLAFGVATRPHPSFQSNGDAFVIVRWFESALIGIIDGLGHGQFAHRAAQSARHYIETHFDLPLDQIFRGTGRACRATRGVVMALARFDWSRDRLSMASIGNIGIRIFPKPDPFHFIVRRGVIGLNAPNPVVGEYSWPLDRVLVFHSDGISTHWDWSDFPGWENRPAAAMAQELLQAKSKPDDDATAIVVRGVIP